MAANNNFRSIRPMADSKKRSPSPMAFYHFFHTIRQNILYCGKSYCLHRYRHQKILRLIVFVVVAAHSVRIFFSVHFYKCNCISMIVCYFSEKYSCNCIFSVNSFFFGFKVVEKMYPPHGRRLRKKYLPHALKR